MNKWQVLENTFDMLSNWRAGRKILKLLYFVKHKKKLKEYELMSVHDYCEKNQIPITYFENEKERELTVIPVIHNSDFAGGGYKKESASISMLSFRSKKCSRYRIYRWNDSRQMDLK